MKTAALVTIALVTAARCLPQAQAALDCSITRQGDAVVISWSSESGKTYALHRSDQPDGSWRVVSLKTAAAEALSETVPVEGTMAFFRLIEAPPNPDPTKLVWIPPGTFTMGSPTNEVDRQESEGPQTTVTISRGFWMGKYEVTQGEYLELMGNNPSWFNGDRTSEGGANYGVNLNRPVETVSWFDATNYCVSLTEQERTAGRIPSNYAYRLATEAEWEYACRAGTTTRYSYGDDPGYTNLRNYAWYHTNSGDQTHPVGQKLPNPWGLYDMHGNVYECCHDWWSDRLPGGIVLDPQGPATGSYRVIRGGYWDSWAENGGGACRSALRDYGLPDPGMLNIGFRVVLAAVDTGEPPNPDPAKLVWIPPGTFTMGSPEDEVDRYPVEGPQTLVTLTRGFWMGKYEVTQGEYESVVGNNPSWFNGMPGAVDYGTDLKRPVETVSWYDAVAYCAALTELERLAGRICLNSHYRLPTEAEWEYACRAGTTTRFSYGDDPGYTELPDYAWYGSPGFDGWTHPVGQKLPNPWGLSDMYGNVMEWCRDWIVEHYSGGTAIDPQGPDAGLARSYRGGGRQAEGRDCRSAYRGGHSPDTRGNGVGFRVVLAPGQP